jgi:hypothetical protein
VENVAGRYVQSKDAKEDAQAEAPESGVLPDTGRKAGLGVEAGGGSLERWFPDLKEGPGDGVGHEGDTGVDLWKEVKDSAADASRKRRGRGGKGKEGPGDEQGGSCGSRETEECHA